MISSAIWNNDTQVFCFFCFFLKSNNESSKKFNSAFFNSNHPKGLSGFFYNYAKACYHARQPDQKRTIFKCQQPSDVFVH